MNAKRSEAEYKIWEVKYSYIIDRAVLPKIYELITKVCAVRIQTQIQNSLKYKWLK